MLNLFRSKTFLKDYRQVKFSDKLYLKYVLFITALLKEEPLPPEAKDHSLQGNLKGHREFHISGDLLVLYRIEEGTLKLIRIGTHAQLFE